MTVTTQREGVAPTRQDNIEKIQADLREIELDVLTNTTIADAMRMGASCTSQATGTFGDGAVQACANEAVLLAIQAIEAR